MPRHELLISALWKRAISHSDMARFLLMRFHGGFPVFRQKENGAAAPFSYG
ncbi:MULTISPECIES: hypothetical protein [Halomonas]|uniref:hypothetical protein n=1 Tax=Halomonas TaxID=2745 RepID=UPI00156EA9CE|nr:MULTISPECIES: hypothetical protein [Halomonas]MDR5889773.1 hypothetical protein [Halomonas salina]WJY06450.1 hypothetical protein QWG60_12150 [Halomonas halophila]